MVNNKESAQEWQFDGLVGPTHNYAGLAYGNVAAALNAGSDSSPRAAALQSLEKMRFVRDLGFKQAFLPPHFRPIISAMKRIGFEGSTSKILETAHREAPHLLASVYSSAFMWTANAATVIPSADSGDGKTHFVPANLTSNYHRSLESPFTTKLLRRIFKNSQVFSVHDPLPQASLFSDEGAANHMRVCSTHGNRGLHIFVYGAGGTDALTPKRYPARQQKAAFEAIARHGGLNPKEALYLQQSPEAIDLGVFHNDVIAMNTTRLMLAHERAFTERDAIRRLMKQRDSGFTYIEISDDQLNVEEAVKSYFFNSQLLERGDGSFVVVAPAECATNPRTKQLFDSLSAGNGPLAQVHYRDVRESMKNGGGPACLRLRVVLTEEEAASMHQGIVLTDATFAAVSAWVSKHYRDRLSFDDLRDSLFIGELEDAYNELAELLGLPGIYDI